MYYIGIDGGGTNTRACIIDKNGKVVGIGKSGPSSIDTVEIEVTLKHFDEAISKVIKEKGIEDFQVEGIFIGVGGVLSDSHKKFVSENITSLPYINDHTVINADNDVANALAGGLAIRTGLCLIAGTGSVAFGVDEDGKSWRCGGYGYKEGDAGSSYDLGRQAINYMARAYDGRLNQTDFSKELFEVLQINEQSDIVTATEKYYKDRTLTASLAPMVTKHANRGDDYCKRICDYATDELALCIYGVYRNINVKNKEVAIIGSLGNSEGYFNKQLIEKIKKIDKEFCVHSPILDPVVGAGLMAYKLSGNTITDDIIKEGKKWY